MKFSSILLFLLGITCFQTHASLLKISKEYLQNNSDILVSATKVETAQFDYESFLLTKTWNLNYNFNKTDGNLESASTFLSTDSTSSSHILSLSKDTEWGGTFSLNNTLSSYETSLSPTTTYGFNQGVSYKQNLGRDFLGRSFQKSKEATASNAHMAKVNHDETIQTGLLKLSQSYFSSALNKSLVKLQKEAKQRAIKRLNLIKRRFKDGLRERVDLYQAEIAVFNQDEQIKAAQIRLKSSLESLATSLHREVSGEEIQGFLEKKYKVKEAPKGEITANKNVELLKETIKINQSSYDKAGYSLAPAVSLTLGYDTNEYDVGRGTAINDGSLQGDKNQTTVAINLTWPLGSRPQRIEKAKALLELETSKKRLQKIEKNLTEVERSLEDRLLMLNKNIDSVLKRRDLAKKALREYNKLYSRGRADLDQVIRAEETLINTEVSYVNYLSQREEIIHAMAYLFGNLKDYMVN